MRLRWKPVIGILVLIALFSAGGKWLLFESVLAPDGTGRRPVQDEFRREPAPE